ncbi:glutamine synthetase [Arthrobacter sp. UCD-GKA]|uniref:glutamine synthetase family protein n=1 Tax=Arthrobacter sp. UCD-GKA TaxID=1913576 RepID=UPI0008DC86A0|nr:glutamine synthetase family protein [Arthrobacter sp. UCD-GKA]OIH84946.1 glutamine synthetase [Arthrobacter sp. UCD-GKA]
MTYSTPRVPLTRLEIPDYALGIRGKMLRSEKTRPDSLSNFSSILYGLSLPDSVTDNAFSNATNGYPDSSLRIDEETRVTLPWRDETEAVIADLVTNDGEPFGASPRGALQRVVERYLKRGLTPVLGYEFEFWIFHDEDRGRRDGETEGLGRVKNAYSLSRIAGAADLIEEFVARMQHIGIEVETFHSELGPGLFEFTLSPQPALRAADNAARAKQYMRELCAERGLAASFMAKPFGGESGAGGHIHSSLMAGGRNIFAEEPGRLSETARQYLAGLLATMSDFTALFAPYVNSYKRFAPDMYVANRPSWGNDDRSVACRTLTSNVSAARVEHRISGADTSPYFSALGVLAGGIHGIENSLDLDETAKTGAPLPTELSEATEKFANSPIAKELLGEIFVGAVHQLQRTEIREYEQWLRTNITSWERSRHLEHH